MGNALNWYADFVIPASFWSYLGVSAIVLFLSITVLCVYETQKMKNKRRPPRGLPAGRKESICMGSFLIAILWPILLLVVPVAIAVTIGVYSVMFMIGEIVNLVLRVLK